VVAIGAHVRIRSIRPPGRRFLPFVVTGDNGAEVVVTITEPGDMGLYRLTTRTPLARALLSSRAGDMVEVHVEAGTSRFEVLAVENKATERRNAL
jgi:hypothetical protein